VRKNPTPHPEITFREKMMDGDDAITAQYLYKGWSDAKTPHIVFRLSKDYYFFNDEELITNILIHELEHHAQFMYLTKTESRKVCMSLNDLVANGKDIRTHLLERINPW
jgi:hypothetical protein